MEKTKNKKGLAILAVMLAFVLMSGVVGYIVFAAVNQIFNFGGKVTFEADGVNAIVTATNWQGCTINGFEFDSVESGRDEILQTITYSTDKSVAVDDSATTSLSWDDLQVVITDTTNGIATLTFQVENTSSEAIMVNIGDITGATSDLTIVADTTSATISAGEKQSFTITFTVVDVNYNTSIDDFSVEVSITVADEYSLTINLENYAYSGEYDTFYVMVDGVVVMSPNLGSSYTQGETYSYSTTFINSAIVSFYGEYASNPAPKGDCTITSNTGIDDTYSFTSYSYLEQVDYTVTQDTVFTVNIA